MEKELRALTHLYISPARTRDHTVLSTQIRIYQVFWTTAHSEYILHCNTVQAHTPHTHAHAHTHD